MAVSCRPILEQAEFIPWSGWGKLVLLSALEDQRYNFNTQDQSLRFIYYFPKAKQQRSHVLHLGHVFQDVRIVHYGMADMLHSRVLAGARASLLRQGVAGLHSAPCLRALLLTLPTLLQEQYQYEKPLVVSGEQLLHSGHLKCLTALVLVLRLDKVLCYHPVPPNHDEHLTVGKYTARQGVVLPSRTLKPCCYIGILFTIQSQN